MKEKILIAIILAVLTSCGQVNTENNNDNWNYYSQEVPIPPDSLDYALPSEPMDEDSLYYASQLSQIPAEPMDEDYNGYYQESSESYDSYDDAYADEGSSDSEASAYETTYYRTNSNCFAELSYNGIVNLYYLIINDNKTGYSFRELSRADQGGVSNYYTSDGILVFSTSKNDHNLNFSGATLHKISKSEYDTKSEAVRGVKSKMLTRQIDDMISAKQFYCYINGSIYSGRYSGNPNAPLMQTGGSAPAYSSTPADYSPSPSSPSTPGSSAADYANRSQLERAYQGYVDMLNAMKNGNYPYQNGYSISKVREIQSQMRSLREQWNASHPDTPIYAVPAETWNGSR